MARNGREENKQDRSTTTHASGRGPVQRQTRCFLRERMELFVAGVGES